MNLMQLGNPLDRQAILHDNCFDVFLLKCRRFAYIDLDDDFDPPTACDRAIGAFTIAFFSVGCTAALAGLGILAAEICKKFGVPVDEQLLMKVNFSLIYSNLAVGSIWGAVHPPHFRTRVYRDFNVL